MRILFVLLAAVGVGVGLQSVPEVRQEEQKVIKRLHRCPCCHSDPCKCKKPDHVWDDDLKQQQDDFRKFLKQKNNSDLLHFPQVQEPEVELKSNATADGPEHNGLQVQTELASRMHLKNKVGTDGAGLCVFTAVTNSSEYVNCDELRGLRDFMTKFPGGGYPEKLDKVIKEYCDSKKLKVPPYVQHTGGDVAFLKEVLAAGRMPSVTYAGNDGVYYNFYIAHMVNLVYLDDKISAILDNNFPGKYLWMDTNFFLDRWRHGGGGWAVAIMTPPPPPVPLNNLIAQRLKDQLAGFPTTLKWEQCKDGKCRLPLVPPTVDPKDYYWKIDAETPGQLNLYLNKQQVGAYKFKEKVFMWFVNNTWYTPSEPPIKVPETYVKEPWEEDAKDLLPYDQGVDYGKISQKYSIKDHHGAELRWDAFCEFIGQSVGDVGNVHLTWVGDKGSRDSFKKMLSNLPLDRTVMVQDYDPSNWAVSDIGMVTGLTYQDDSGRVIWRSDSLPDINLLVEGLRKRDPAYDPKKDKQLTDSVNPSPVSAPKLPLWLLAVLAVGGYLLLKKVK